MKKAIARFLNFIGYFICQLLMLMTIPRIAWFPSGIGTLVSWGLIIVFVGIFYYADDKIQPVSPVPNEGNGLQ